VRTSPRSPGIFTRINKNIYRAAVLSRSAKQREETERKRERERERERQRERERAREREKGGIKILEREMKFMLRGE